MREALRVTTDADYFDQHASSVELWSPGSPLFPRMDARETPPEVTGRRLADTMKGAPEAKT
jgi:hypothetical protein